MTLADGYGLNLQIESVRSRNPPHGLQLFGVIVSDNRVGKRLQVDSEFLGQFNDPPWLQQG